MDRVIPSDSALEEKQGRRARPPISSPGGGARSPQPAPPATSEEQPPKAPKAPSIAPRPVGDLPFQPLALTASCAFGGALLMAICLMPLGLGQTAFVAVAPWAWLTLDARRMTRWAYPMLYFAGVAQWLCLSVVEITLGNGALISNLPVIAYLALYVPAFVLLGRAAREWTRLPAYLLLPVIWCGLELIRCHLFGGFSLAMLAHAAADTRRILQLTDLAGSYGLGMLMVASGASVAELLWITRRIKRLEQHLPHPERSADQLQREASVGGRFSVPGFGERAKKRDTESSMQAAMRRNRDRARELHLIMVTVAVAVIVGVLVFANFYGRERVVETNTWKLFESNLYSVEVLGGPGAAELFSDHAGRPQQSLLITSLSQELPQDGLDAAAGKRPVLAIFQAANGDWKVTMRHAGQWNEKPLGKVSGANAFWSQRPVGQAYSRSADVPLTIMAAVDSNATIEDSVNRAIRNLPHRGRGLDMMFLSIDPSYLDGSRWPRLMTRSVMAAAVANRCPVIAVVPDRWVAVATGEGKLWWSSAMAQQGSSSDSGDPMTDGKHTDAPIRVHAMIDPRAPAFAKLGATPAYLCMLLTILVPVGYGLKHWAQLASAIRNAKREK